MHFYMNSFVLLAVHNDLPITSGFFRNRADDRQVTARSDVSRTRQCHVTRTQLGELPEAHVVLHAVAPVPGDLCLNKGLTMSSRSRVFRIW